MSEIEDERYVQAAVRLWEEPHHQENTLLIQRGGFDSVALGAETVDRVSDGAWVLAWVYVSDEEATET